MKIKAKTKDYQLIVGAKASHKDKIDMQFLDRFSRMYMRGFLKVNEIKKGEIIYGGPTGISLSSRLQKPISKHDFLLIIEYIITSVQRIVSNGLSLQHLIMHVDYAYINEQTKEVQMLYLPTKEMWIHMSLLEMLRDIVSLAKPAVEDDPTFAMRFSCFLNSLIPFDPKRIEQYIEKEDRSVINTIKRLSVGQSGFMTDKALDYYEHYEQKTMNPSVMLSKSQQATSDTQIPDCAHNDPLGMFMGQNSATVPGNTGIQFNQQSNVPYAGSIDSADLDDATGLLIEEDETSLLVDDGLEETSLLVEDNYVTYPTIVRIHTGEKVSVNKPVFRIGKERSYVDFFIANNSAVSRSHADIVTRGGRYFVIDLNSKNRTFINGQPIPVQSETEIRNGDKLRLANEEFEFYV